MTRHCACGCEKELKGSSTQRFASDACRKRAARAAARRNGSADGVADNPDAGHRPQITPGRVRSGLESWLEDHDDLPAPLVAAARALSDEVDRRPSASPLWGRLTTILTELVTPQVQAQALTEDLRRLYEYLLIGRADEEWRHEKHMQAIERGDPLADVWQRVVPIGCVRGRHSWKPHPDFWGAVRCQHCDTEQRP